MAAVIVGCGPGAQDPCAECITAQNHMAEKIAANDCNPNYMQEAVDGIIEACGEVVLEDDAQLDVFRLIGAIHETCQAERTPVAQCEPAVTATFQLEVAVDQKVLDRYPSGVVVSAIATSLSGGQGAYRKVTVTSPSATTMDKLWSRVPDGTEISVFVHDAANDGGVATALADAEENLVIRQSEAGFDRWLRRIRVSESIDGLVLIGFELW